MAKLENLKRGAAVKGIFADCLVRVIGVKWYGSAAVDLTYNNPTGKPNAVLLVYILRPFQQVPDCAVESVNYNLGELLARAEVPV